MPSKLYNTQKQNTTANHEKFEGSLHFLGGDDSVILIAYYLQRKDGIQNENKKQFPGVFGRKLQFLLQKI